MTQNPQKHHSWSKLSELLVNSYPLLENNSHPDMDNNRLLTFLKQGRGCPSLLEALESQLPIEQNISPQQYSILKFIDQLFDNYCRNSQLANGLKSSVSSLRSLFAQRLLQQQLPWGKDNNLCLVVELINQHAIGWQPELGRAAERFLQALNTLLVEADGIDISVNTILVKLGVFFDREQRRIAKLEQRLCAAEMGVLQASHAKQLSARILNTQMHGKSLPEVVCRFLQGPWRDSMQLLIINDGENTDSWSRFLSLTETIIWSLQPYDHNDEEYRQQLYRSIVDVTDDIREVTIGLQYSSKQDEELEVIEREHLKVLKGEELDYQPFSLIDSQNPLLSAQASISKSLINQAQGCQEGQWFIDQSEDVPIRIKLIAKMNDTQQYLFSNFLGIKAAQYSVEEFAYLLSAKIIRPLNTRDQCKATAEKIIATLELRLQQKQQKNEQKNADQLELLRQQQLATESAKDKAIAEARLLEQSQAAIRQEQQRKIQLHDEQREQVQHEKTIRSQLEQLNVGSVVVFYNEHEQEETCKLAAVIQSSGEYIFVNRRGIKFCSLKLDDLTRQVLAEQASIIELGSSFENTLETVVNNLRTRKNHG